MWLHDDGFVDSLHK